jgi:hypothetical protein
MISTAEQNILCSHSIKTINIEKSRRVPKFSRQFVKVLVVVIHSFILRIQLLCFIYYYILYIMTASVNYYVVCGLN